VFLLSFGFRKGRACHTVCFRRNHTTECVCVLFSWNRLTVYLYPSWMPHHLNDHIPNYRIPSPSMVVAIAVCGSVKFESHLKRSFEKKKYVQKISSIHRDREVIMIIIYIAEGCLPWPPPGIL
jgi:hypothetical protein